MNSSKPDIYRFALLHHESLEFPEGHARSLQLFKESVVHPSLNALTSAIDANARDEDPTSVFYENDLAELYQTTVASYLLAVQSMWERGLRKLLITREKALETGIKVADIQMKSWSGKGINLHTYFERLLGIPITAFDSYGDLDLLQNLGNAIRHGDGDSAKRVHELAPSLWFNWLAPGEVIHAGPCCFIVPDGAPKHPSFSEVTLEERLLKQMIQSVTIFWQDLEYVRCNSFRRQDDSVTRQLEKWVAERRTRDNDRFWTSS